MRDTQPTRTECSITDSETENESTEIVDSEFTCSNNASLKNNIESKTEIETENSIMYTPISEVVISEDDSSDVESSNNKQQEQLHDDKQQQQLVSDVNTFTFNSNPNKKSPVKSHPISSNVHIFDSCLSTKTNITKSTVNVPSHQDDPPLTRMIKFNLEAITRRLEKGQRTRESESERERERERCFRAKITPTSNKDAESELRKEIRCVCVCMCVCVCAHM